MGGHPVVEFDGLAHAGKKIDDLGGVLPFDALKGRTFHPSYFYDPAFPQVEVFRASEPEVDRRRKAGEAINEAVNNINIIPLARLHGTEQQFLLLDAAEGDGSSGRDHSARLALAPEWSLPSH